ncbi:hypothetical protein AB1Y20_016517 [Prymnesium parvum]|uniref:Centrosomal protein of 70 kDa n=1 Tax=Prymnesium parvum TaxID=97485 RepID=A0AB34ID00_PRYPA
MLPPRPEKKSSAASRPAEVRPLNRGTVQRQVHLLLDELASAGGAAACRGSAPLHESLKKERTHAHVSCAGISRDYLEHVLPALCLPAPPPPASTSSSTFSTSAPTFSSTTISTLPYTSSSSTSSTSAPAFSSTTTISSTLLYTSSSSTSAPTFSSTTISTLPYTSSSSTSSTSAPTVSSSSTLPYTSSSSTSSTSAPTVSSSTISTLPYTSSSSTSSTSAPAFSSSTTISSTLPYTSSSSTSSTSAPTVSSSTISTLPYTSSSSTSSTSAPAFSSSTTISSTLPYTSSSSTSSTSAPTVSSSTISTLPYTSSSSTSSTSAPAFSSYTTISSTLPYTASSSTSYTSAPTFSSSTISTLPYTSSSSTSYTSAPTVSSSSTISSTLPYTSSSSTSTTCTYSYAKPPHCPLTLPTRPRTPLSGGRGGHAYWGGRTPRRPSVESTLSSPSVAPPHDAEACDSAASSRRSHESFDDLVRSRQERIQRYVDTISDLQLTEQLQAYRLNTTAAQVEKLLREGVLAARNNKLAQRLENKRSALVEQLHNVEERAAALEHINTGLMDTINALRRGRQYHATQNAACAVKEKTMAIDMHGFSASAHAALDEKERLAARLRRLRHEYKFEVTAAEMEADAVNQSLKEEQERQLEFEQNAVRDAEWSRFQEYRAIRRHRAKQERFKVRLGYLSHQLATLREQFAQLARLAGSPADFDAGSPRNHQSLVAAVAAKEAANESRRFYLDEMRHREEALVKEIAELDGQERALQVALAAAESAETVQQRQEESAEARQRRVDRKVAALEATLLEVRGHIARVVRALIDGYDRGAVPLAPERVIVEEGCDVDYPPIEEARAKCSEKDLEGSVFRDGGYTEMSFPVLMVEVEQAKKELTRLDAFVHAVQARAVRLATWLERSHQANQPPGGPEAPPRHEMPAAVRVFTELVPASMYKEETHSIRHDLEKTVARHRDDFLEALEPPCAMSSEL